MDNGQASGDGLMIDTVGGVVTLPAPVISPLPPVMIYESPPENRGNTVVAVGALAVVLMVLAWVGLRAHGE